MSRYKLYFEAGPIVEITQQEFDGLQSGQGGERFPILNSEKIYLVEKIDAVSEQSAVVKPPTPEELRDQAELEKAQKSHDKDTILAEAKEAQK